MRLQIELATVEGDHITLPLHYNKAVQGMIYNLLSEYLPELHNHGYVIEGRVFRLFVFSRIEGRICKIKDGGITFEPPIRIQIASPINYILELVANRLLENCKINLEARSLNVEAVSLRKNPDFSKGRVLCRAISPITVYSTLFTASGSKRTYYYHPKETEFAELIRNNLIKKAAILGFDAATDSFSIEPVVLKNTDQKIVYYKDFVIRGWMGKYLLTGSPRLLEVAYDAGLGSKNSQGFGMIEVIKT